VGGRAIITSLVRAGPAETYRTGVYRHEMSWALWRHRNRTRERMKIDPVNCERVLRGFHGH